MEMKIQPVFPSFISSAQLENDLDNDAIVAFCYDRYNQCPSFKYAGGWQSEHLSKELLEHDALEPLHALLNKSIEEIKHVVGIRADVPHRLANYWININEPGISTHHLHHMAPHFHPNYFLSCVYYPKASVRCGDLYFSCPHQGVKNSVPSYYVDKGSLYNDVDWHITPEAGKLVIFPNWLTHWVTPNHSEDDRISIAFNIALPPIDV